MKKWAMAVAAVLSVALIVWIILSGNNIPPQTGDRDNSPNQPGVSRDGEDGQNTPGAGIENPTNRSNEDYGIYPGDKAYVFELTDLEDNIVSLSYYSDKVVLINFWQTTCSWCQDELPLLDELYKNYKDNGLVVLAINIGEEKEKVLQLVEEKGFTFPVLLDREAEVAKKFLISNLPTNYIINPNGSISAMHIGYMEYRQMESYIEAAFREDR